MASERFEIEPEVVNRESRGCLKGCLVALGVILLLIAVVTFWIVQNWRGWTVRLIAHTVDESMEAANLPHEERVQVRAEMNRVFDAFQAGTLSARQLEILSIAFAQSPLMTSIVVSAVDAQYLNRSGLTEEEKAIGSQTLRRFVRGVVQGEIEEQKVDEVLVHIADQRPDGNWHFRDKASDEELRSLLEVAKRHADAAEIPEEAEVFSPSEEVRRIIDQALAEDRLPEAEPEIVEP